MSLNPRHSTTRRLEGKKSHDVKFKSRAKPLRSESESQLSGSCRSQGCRDGLSHQLPCIHGADRASEEAYRLRMWAGGRGCGHRQAPSSSSFPERGPQPARASVPSRVRDSSSGQVGRARNNWLPAPAGNWRALRVWHLALGENLTV